jgi:hypothetical protein
MAKQLLGKEGEKKKWESRLIPAGGEGMGMGMNVD